MYAQGEEQITYQPAIATGLQTILAHDPVLRKLDIDPAVMNGVCLQTGFPGMLALILGQQISFKVAAKLWRRLASELAGDITPASFLALPRDVRQNCGFSRQKDSYACGLAHDITQGRLDVRELETLDDDEAIAMLTSIRGIGTWSAQLYLIFALARPDIWPAGDLGIQVGVQHYCEMDERPGHSATHAAGERFKPHRTAGALLMWELKRLREG